MVVKQPCRDRGVPSPWSPPPLGTSAGSPAALPRRSPAAPSAAIMTCRSWSRPFHDRHIMITGILKAGGAARPGREETARAPRC